MPDEFRDEKVVRQQNVESDVEAEDVDGVDELDCIETVQESASYLEPDPDDEDDFGDEEEPHAWVTIIDPKGQTRQRKLYELPLDLLSGKKKAVNAINKLPVIEIPSEKSVTEGFCINIATKEINLWGRPNSHEKFLKAKESWIGWKVSWTKDGGYETQCHASGQAGSPLSDAEALSTFLPSILSNKRMTFANIMGAMGGSLKKTAIKGTGCLTALLAIPILLTGFFMGKMMAALYAVVALVVIMVILFKVFERRIKSKFMRNDAADMMTAKDEAMESQRSPVAGPEDEKERKAKLNELLGSCGLPSWEKLEQQFPEMSESVL